MHRELEYIFDLTIILVTYNHEKYVSKALSSIYGQKTDMRIQLIVADDGSSDDTLKIIKAREKLNTKITYKYLDSKSNVGITRNYQRAFAAAEGKYVAILEGDDYWINPKKLDTQADFLEEHWECALCSANYYVFDESKHTFTKRIDAYDGYSLLGARDLIHDNIIGNFSTCMYCCDALKKLPVDLFNMTSYDWIVNITISRNALIGFLHKPMSVYRLHQSGTWSGKNHVDKLKLQLELIVNYDALLEYAFQKEFRQLSNRLCQEIKKLSEPRLETQIEAKLKPRKNLFERLKRSAEKRFRTKK